MTIFDKIYAYNRNPEISEWLQQQLETLISFGIYHNEIENITAGLASQLAEYRTQHNIDNVVIGMSGGIDSAVTAALFKRAGYTVTGVTMPIHQNPEETDRGIEACRALGIEHIHADLTHHYDQLVDRMVAQDADIKGETHADKVRRGNVRARLRMITLYNLAGVKGGFVASTDNFSELAAGFWTLHGDVGDVAPIQSLTKSWEVPAMAEHLGVPESIIAAKPTDGLGIANGDEDQFGFSYLAFDIVLMSLLQNPNNDKWLEGASEADLHIVSEVKKRIAGTTYKRLNPHNLQHPVHQLRYAQLEMLDNTLKGE